MENWIEKIKEAIRIAMNKGLCVKYYTSEIIGIPHEIIWWINKEDKICIKITENTILINTPTGLAEIAYSITDRDDLELRALGLSIKEYNEDMAISEFNEFISDKENKLKDINDLDNDEE